MTNYFIENSINIPNRCGWVNCNNVSEPGSGRCIHHINRDKKISPEPYIGMRFKLGAVYISWTPTHDKVWQAYKIDKSVVNDDADLFAAIAEPLWDYSASLKENLRRLPRDSNITRRRRELHQAGYIEYSPKADKRRSKAMKNEIDIHSPIPPQVRYELMTINGEKVMKVVNDLVDSVKPYEQGSLL